MCCASGGSVEAWRVSQLPRLHSRGIAQRACIHLDRVYLGGDDTAKRYLSTGLRYVCTGDCIAVA
eukprot:1344375-Rhodomonas_salina.3